MTLDRSVMFPFPHLASAIISAFVGSVCLASPPGLPAAVPTSAPAATQPSFVTLQEEPLGSVDGYDNVRNITLCVDGNHAAFVGVRDKQQCVVLDGKPGPWFDWIIGQSLAFSPDGSHLAYLIQSATETLPVIDGKTEAGFYSIDHIIWSPNSQRHALVGQYKEGKFAAVVDGVVGEKFDAVELAAFSPDSSRIACLVKRDKTQAVIVDGIQQKWYEAVGNLTFSPNSRHVAYEAIAGKKAMLVLNGQESKGYDAIPIGPGFSNDSLRVLGVATQAGKLLVVINGREIGPYEALVAGDFILSPDGKHVAYAVKDGPNQFVILDGVRQQGFHHIGGNALTFSPDSNHMAYVASAEKEGADFVVVDGKRLPECQGVLAGTPLFSPDSKRLAYGARRNGKWQLNVDGVEGKPYDIIEPPTVQIFSPDSQHFAYRASNNKKPVVVWDGAESGPATNVGPIAFSPDGKHIAYLHTRDQNTWLVIDHHEVAGPYNEATPQLRPIFDDSVTLHVIVTRLNAFVRVVAKLKQ